MSIFLNLGVQTTPDFMRGEPQEHLLENVNGDLTYKRFVDVGVV